MAKRMHFTEDQIDRMAECILDTLAVTPLSNQDKCRIVREFSLEEFGAVPPVSVVLLAVKRAGLGWEAIGMVTKRIIGD